jgi:hypothetical protein
MKTAIKEIKVGLDFGTGVQSVGRLAIRNGIIYFEYDNDFLQTGIEISPIKLPLKRGLIEFPVNHFEGLAGVLMIVCPMVGEDCFLTVCFVLKVFYHQKLLLLIVWLMLVYKVWVHWFMSQTKVLTLIMK